MLKPSDLIPKVQSQIKTQDYQSKHQIEGVKLVKLKIHVGDEGYLSEIFKINGEGTAVDFPSFKLKQINSVKMYPGSVKAWHLHLKQDEIWYVRPDSHLIIGLWDVRKNSKTSGVTTRMALGESKSELLFIPKGVAHGSANISNKMAELMYLIDQQFNSVDPDELRLPWDSVGSGFWTPKKE